MSIDYAEIGQRIALRRRELGLKQSQVCELCELSDKYLSGIERARSIPSIDVLMRICQALDTTPNALLLGTSTNSDKNLRSYIEVRTEELNTRQLSLLSSFIDWLRNQADI